MAITGLTSGTDYLIQLWVADTRGCCSQWQKTYDSGGGAESVTLDTGPPSSYVIGTFTEDGSSQDIHFRGSSATHPQYNAIQVRTAGASIPSFTLTQLSENTGTILQKSSDLNHWTPATLTPSSVNHLPNGFAEITYLLPSPLASTEFFLRLQISEL